MTERKKRAVPDDVLGKVCRKIIDLSRRILEGGVEPERAAFFIAGAQELPGMRFHVDGCTIGDYVLECKWAWDNSHTTFATIALEKSEYKYGFEVLPNCSVPQKEKEPLMKLLRDLCNKQSISPWPEMVMLYKVLQERRFGTDYPTHGTGTRPKNTMVDWHFVLKPIVWFDKNGTPMPV